MSLTFAGHLDRDVLVAATDAVAGLVTAPEVTAAWTAGSALPGMTVGGLARHLVSQPECAVAFLSDPGRADAPVLTLVDYFDRVDWWQAPVDAAENTSIRDDFNAMAAPGPAEAVGVLTWARSALPEVLPVAGPTTYVPWQDCRLARDDFVVCRLVEMVVHADDLAVSVGLPTPDLPASAVEAVAALLATLSVRRHGATAVVRALARRERPAGHPAGHVAAF